MTALTGLIDIAVRRAAGHRVKRVRVGVGAFHPLILKRFHDEFARAARGTVVEGAAVDLRVVPAEFHCRDCHGVTEFPDDLDVCPGCGSTNLTKRGGDALALERLDRAES